MMEKVDKQDIITAGESLVYVHIPIYVCFDLCYILLCERFNNVLSIPILS